MSPNNAAHSIFKTTGNFNVLKLSRICENFGFFQLWNNFPKVFFVFFFKNNFNFLFEVFLGTEDSYKRNSFTSGQVIL